MSEDEDSLKTCKVVLLGESGVGKTCIISRYINGTFDEGVVSTNGASYAGKTMTFEDMNKSIKFEIWDTAGQEKYRSLTKIFYKDAAVAVLVYDITNAKSYEELKNYWYNQIRDSAPRDIVLAIAANKSDLIGEEVVSEGEVRKYAQEIGAIFMSTSAYNSSGIDELFKEVGHKFLDPSYMQGQPTPQKPKHEIRPSGSGSGGGFQIGKTDEHKEKKGGCCK